MAPIARTAPATRSGFDPDYLPAFEDKLFIEGPLVRRRLVNFFVLLVLATVIATYGVLSGSTATVIGAMIVAPLMGPIMATTAAVVMGSLPRALCALALVVVGVMTVVALSSILAAVVPDVAISFTGNSEISSRINTEVEMRQRLVGFTIELLVEVEEDRPTALGDPKHWHVYEVVARRQPFLSSEVVR